MVESYVEKVTMRVFVLEPTEYSMFKAKRFGTLVFLFNDESDHSPWHDAKFLIEIERELETRGFRPSEDAVAVSGKMISTAILVAVVARVYGDVKLLCFDHDAEVRDFREVDLSCCAES